MDRTSDDASAPARDAPSVGGDLCIERVSADPIRFLVDAANTYGDTFRYTLDGRTAVVVSHPYHVRHVLREVSIYSKAGTPDLMMLRPMLGDGLMTSVDEAWEWQRKLVQPAFHAARVEAFARHIVALTEDMLATWARAASTSTPIDVAAELGTLTLRIVSRCLFGVDVADDAGAYADAMKAMNLFAASRGAGAIEARSQFHAGLATITRIAQTIVEARRRSSAGHDDLLATLLEARAARTGQALTPRQLRDQICTLLIGGGETTGQAVTWSLHLLGQHRAWFSRIREEARALLDEAAPTAASASQLGVTWMVAQEAMRLYPPVWLMSRVALRHDTIGGYSVPAGSLVIVSPYLVHRHPAFWEEPDRFDPERFTPERAKARPAHAYLPFSSGPRVCVGQALATLEVRIVLAMIARRFTLRPVPEHVVEPDGSVVTLHPRGGLPMTVHPQD
ncbi:cytochrome P450 [Sorangium sp. So ce429]